MSEYITLPYIKVKQPIGDYFISSINYKDLIKIAEADIRKIDEEAQRDDSFDSYLGIQRKVSQNRVKEISEYVRTIDATFPTSIILHIESEEKFIHNKSISQYDPDYIDENIEDIEIIPNIIINADERVLMIRKNDKVARILDGQHRIEGLRQYILNYEDGLFPEGLGDFDLNITIFIDLDIDDQAQIFSVINKAQTKVNKSLVYDLFEYAKFRSPQKTAHDVVRLLNRMEGSPFYKRIKILGTAENSELETIAQATFVELIIEYISINPMADRDVLKRSSFFKKHSLKRLESENEIKKYIFRNLFIDEKDEIIFQNIWNFFEAVREKWPTSWEENKAGSILNKSTGIIALMRFYRSVVHKLDIYEGLIRVEDFNRIFNSILIEDGAFSKEIYLPGSSGQSRLLKELKSYL